MITEETIEQIRNREVIFNPSDEYFWRVVDILMLDLKILNLDFVKDGRETVNCEDLYNYLINKKIMITYEQYAEQFAREKGYNDLEQLYCYGLFAGEIEEFTKGYARIAIESQRNNDADSTDLVAADLIFQSPLIELI